MRKRTLGMGIVLAALASFSPAAPAVAGTAGAPGSAKEGLAGPAAELFCVGLSPAPDDNVSQPGPGFVVFNQDISANTVSANVVLQNAQPNTTYVIRLIQDDGSDCFIVDAALTTNGQGNGEAQAVEPIDPGTNAVNVIVDTGAVVQTPTYRAPDNYSLVSGTLTAPPTSGSGTTTASP